MSRTSKVAEKNALNNFDDVKYVRFITILNQHPQVVAEVFSRSGLSNVEALLQVLEKTLADKSKKRLPAFEAQEMIEESDYSGGVESSHHRQGRVFHQRYCGRRLEVDTKRVIRLKEVMHKTGLSRGTIYNRINEGSFPEKIQLGPRAIGFLEHEIDKWMNQLARGAR